MNAVTYAKDVAIVNGTVCKFCFFPASHPNDDSTCNIHLRNVTSAQKNKCKINKLQYIQEFVRTDVMYHVFNKKSMLITSFDIVSGFGTQIC